MIETQLEANIINYILSHVISTGDMNEDNILVIQ